MAGGAKREGQVGESRLWSAGRAYGWEEEDAIWERRNRARGQGKVRGRENGVDTWQISGDFGIPVLIPFI